MKVNVRKACGKSSLDTYGSVHQSFLPLEVGLASTGADIVCDKASLMILLCVP